MKTQNQHMEPATVISILSFFPKHTESLGLKSLHSGHEWIKKYYSLRATGVFTKVVLAQVNKISKSHPNSGVWSFSSSIV